MREYKYLRMVLRAGFSNKFLSKFEFKNTNTDSLKTHTRARSYQTLIISHLTPKSNQSASIIMQMEITDIVTIDV